MLSNQTIDIVKATAPLLAETGPKLTAHFTIVCSPITLS